MVFFMSRALDFIASSLRRIPNAFGIRHSIIVHTSLFATVFFCFFDSSPALLCCAKKPARMNTVRTGVPLRKICYKLFAFGF